MTVCKICHCNEPLEGRQVCNVCMGFESAPAPVTGTEIPKEIDHAIDIDVKCETCGEVIIPYKIGPNYKTKGECKTCFYKRKYGPDWYPGIRSFKEKRRKAKKERGKQMGAIAKKQESANTEPFVHHAPPESHHNDEGSFHGDFVVKLVFDTRDQAMYRKIQEVATSQRRTTAAQILHFLDGVLWQDGRECDCVAQLL